MEEGYRCPLCGDRAEYHKHNDTHIWICRADTCPHVSIEFYDKVDLENLTDHLLVSPFGPTGKPEPKQGEIVSHFEEIRAKTKHF